MRKHFDFYGYNSPTSGLFYSDNEVYCLGEDYRNVKRYKEYKNVGFNILLLQHDNSYSGEYFNSSACKKCMDKAYKAGIDKVIVSDTRLKDLCTVDNLVGIDGKFKTEKEYLSYLQECIKPYESHPAFYGVQLFDEPQIQYLKNYAKVYRGLKTIKPSIEIQANLLNLCAPNRITYKPTNLYQDYENYLVYFLEQSKIDYLMTDEYAFRRNNVVSEYTIPTFQILAKVCKERNVEMRLVLQSFSQEGRVAHGDIMEGGVAWRRVSEKDMYWQMNLALGFGCKEFSMFTYFTKAHIYFAGHCVVSGGIDGAAMVNLDGTRTKLYYAVKKIIKEFKQFEPVIINYNFYKDFYFFQKDKNYKDYNQTSKLAFQNINCDVDVETNAESICVCELHNNQNRMFMIENISNPVNQLMYKQKANLVEINLRKLKGKLNFYKKGQKIELSTNNNCLALKMNCGDAIFIEEIR